MAHRVTDHGDLKKYRTEIPNIVLTLGLSPYELTLYVHLKRTAGDSGVCWKSTTTLAKETCMGAATVSRAKEGLQQPRESLKGLPLIVIEEEENPKGGKPRHRITLNDIWPQNMSHWASSTQELDKTKQVPQGKLQVPQGNLTSSTQELKKEPLEERTQEESKRDFLSDLKNDPFYSHVDFDVEIERMRRWLARPANRNRRLTERFVLGWIEKIDRPVVVPTSGNGTDRAAKEERLKKQMGWDKLEQRA